MEYMLMPLRRYADFKGRSRRKEYWMYSLFLFLMFLGLGAVGAVFGALSEGEPGLMGSIFLGIIGLAAIAIVIPSIAVQVRRFHDQDKSGWFVLIGLIPYLGGLIVFVFMCMSGTRGPNRFGPDPKGPDSEHLEETFS